MKIVITKNGIDSKVLLDDGQDITADLRISSIEIRASADGLVKAVLTVFPSESTTELEDGQLEFRKHPDWDSFKS